MWAICRMQRQFLCVFFYPVEFLILDFQLILLGHGGCPLELFRGLLNPYDYPCKCRHKDDLDCSTFDYRTYEGLGLGALP